MNRVKDTDEGRPRAAGPRPAGDASGAWHWCIRIDIGGEFAS